MCSWTEDEETLCARVELFTLWSPFSSLLSPCSFQPSPCLGSALHSSHLIPAQALPALLLPQFLPPTTHPSLSQTHHPSPHHQLMSLSPPSQGFCQPCDPPWKCFLAAAAESISSSHKPWQFWCKKRPKRLHLFCIQKILEKNQIQGGKNPKHLRNAKPFSSVNKNYFKVTSDGNLKKSKTIFWAERADEESGISFTTKPFSSPLFFL